VNTEGGGDVRVVASADVCAHLGLHADRFWPTIRELYRVGRGWIVESDAQALRVVRRWIIYDWLLAVAVAVAFLLPVRAISVSFPGAQGSRSSLE